MSDIEVHKIYSNFDINATIDIADAPPLIREIIHYRMLNLDQITMADYGSSTKPTRITMRELVLSIGDNMQHSIKDILELLRYASEFVLPNTYVAIFALAVDALFFSITPNQVRKLTWKLEGITGLPLVAIGDYEIPAGRGSTDPLGGSMIAALSPMSSKKRPPI